MRARHSSRYPEEFKIEAVKQVTERNLPVAEVAARLDLENQNCRDGALYYAACSLAERKRKTVAMT